MRKQLKIKFHLIFVLILSFFAGNCGPGDGSTLNPLGEPLGPPELTVDPSELVVTLEKGKTVDITIQLKNTGGFPLEIKNITSASNWIAIQNYSLPILIDSGDSIQISLSIGEANLQSGSFQNSLTIMSDDGDIDDSEYSLPVKLTVTEPFAFDPILSKIQSKVFNLSCTECHGKTNPAAGLSLASGNSHSNLVNVLSSQVSGIYLVEPYNPDNSYIIRKLEGEPDINGGRMPLDQSPISQEYINVIRAWISQGAQNN